MFQRQSPQPDLTSKPELKPGLEREHDSRGKITFCNDLFRHISFNVLRRRTAELHGGWTHTALGMGELALSVGCGFLK